MRARDQGTGSELPVRTDTIVGCLYYLYDSRMVGDFEGLSMVKGAAEREGLVVRMGRWYCLKSQMSAENGGNTVRSRDRDGEGVNFERIRVDYVS